MTIRHFAIIVGIVVGATAIFGAYLSGSPITARKIRIDEARSEELRQISYAVQAYAETHEKQLPENLSVILENPLQLGYSYGDGLDPMTKKPYEYRKINDKNFELCAEFETNTAAENEKDTIYRYGDGNASLHGIGRSCFVFASDMNGPKPVVLPTPSEVSASSTATSTVSPSSTKK